MMSLMLKSLIKNRLTIALLSLAFFSLSFLLTNANASTEIVTPKISVVSQKYLQQNKRSISSMKKVKAENLAQFEINNNDLLELKGFKTMKKISYKKLNVSLAKLN
jgi:hypothetical protein